MTVPPDAARPRAFFAFQILTAGVCGAIVMVLEVLGSKVLSPFFGVSLFVWTSLITVTLVALALGYAAGGMVADRGGTPAHLYGAILVAGLLVLAIPHAKGLVLKSAMGLGLRSGSLVAAAALFGPALFLLGCVSPLVVALTVRELSAVGRTVGLFYAVSTMGSFAGTLATGFVLVAYFRVDRIFVVAGGTLLALGAAYFVLFARRRAVALLLLAPLVLREPPPFRSKVQGNGTRVEVVYAKDGFYGNVKVLDYSYGTRRIRELMIDGLIQGGIDMADGQSVYTYPYLMELLPYGINPSGKSCLALGLGAGIIPRWYEARGIRTDVVDIDAGVVDVARRYFAFQVSGEVVVADARQFLTTTDKRYDYVIVDLANGDWAPSHVLCLEAFQLLKQRMTPDGILAINLIGDVERDTFMTASTIATLGQVFGTVKVFVNVEPGRGAGVQNLELVAYDMPGATFDRARVEGFPIHPMVEAGVRGVLGKEFSFPAGTPSTILTDDYSPFERLDLRVKETIREGILAYTDWEVLL